MFRSPVGNFRLYGDGQARESHHGRWTQPGFPQPNSRPYGHQMPSQPDLTGSLKRPPAWSPDYESVYPYRLWQADVILWSLGTDVEERRKAPLIVLALGGAARDLAREIPLNILANGAVADLGDGAGPQQLSGVTYLLNGLSRRFAPLPEEGNVRAMADLYGFHRLPGERTDAVLARWEAILLRARTLAGVTLQPSQAAWLLLLALRIPAEHWVQILAPFAGMLPTDERQYEHMLAYLKRFGHLAEGGAMSIVQGASTHGPGTFFQEPNQDNGSAFVGNVQPRTGQHCKASCVEFGSSLASVTHLNNQ
eukprot:TRINITY_DN7046_c0_g1_i1.p1 TRINITY_DN7046_c0_g1~~TRINITY_DN7046_c0_g1_i1.p1  ORF type:complete len:308 (-),score=45.25 TRINITY_DN7046_c0_g1_i1:616-1539(-)